mmetsp:Transcript_17453/g.28189  ORF Transcript_17453/g.28189 Transcript_17453/m.28189 type:complete len:178 (+) Transcript_17453:1423-1956(+)
MFSLVRTHAYNALIGGTASCLLGLLLWECLNFFNSRVIERQLRLANSCEDTVCIFVASDDENDVPIVEEVVHECFPAATVKFVRMTHANQEFTNATTLSATARNWAHSCTIDHVSTVNNHYLRLGFGICRGFKDGVHHRCVVIVDPLQQKSGDAGVYSTCEDTLYEALRLAWKAFLR